MTQQACKSSKQNEVNVSPGYPFIPQNSTNGPVAQQASQATPCASPCTPGPGAPAATHEKTGCIMRNAVHAVRRSVADRRSLPYALQLKPFTLLYRIYAIIYACATDAHSLFCCPSCLEAVHIRLRHVETFKIVKII